MSILVRSNPAQGSRWHYFKWARAIAPNNDVAIEEQESPLARQMLMEKERGKLPLN